MAPGVLVWWIFLSLVSVVNVAGWIGADRALRRRRDQYEEEAYQRRRRLLMLAGVYVLGCAFRSFLPRADVQRICLVDSILSSVTVGRSIATVAELCFAAQWAILLSEYGRDSRIRTAQVIAVLLVPLITFAEISSWYAVITTNFLGNAIEQSTWTFCGALLGISFLLIRRQAASSIHGFLDATIACAAAFVTFMSTADVPLYLSRWRAQRVAGVEYLDFASGLHDSTFRWIVAHSWEPWKNEVTWMALYFSIGVWISIALSHAPRFVGHPGKAHSREVRGVPARM